MSLMTSHIPIEALKQLASAGVLAPSGDNLQPWKFELCPDVQEIRVLLDEDCDQSPMNGGQRMSKIAVGAAVENVIQTAVAAGMDYSCKSFAGGSCVGITFSNYRGAEVKIPATIKDRATNRRLYDARSIPPPVLEALNQIGTDSEDVHAHWVTDRRQVRQIAEIVAAADELLFKNSAMRKAFLENVRFDRAIDEVVDWGLSLGSLEMERKEISAFRLLPRMPQWLFRLLRVSRTIGKKSGVLTQSASGVCVLSHSKSADFLVDCQVGRVLQRVWLELTRHSIAAQPMMSLMVLKNSIQSNSDCILSSSSISRSRELVDRLVSLFPSMKDSIPAFLLRFGYAQKPSVRTGRIGRESKSKTTDLTS